MEKIPTIFDRNWDGNRKVNEKLVVLEFDFENAIATEKLDGTNVRITVRNHTVVRVEKRKNPSKIQKQKGIKDPWYIDAYRACSRKKNWEKMANINNLNKATIKLET